MWAEKSLGTLITWKDVTDGLTELIPSTDVSHPEAGDLFQLGKSVKCLEEYGYVWLLHDRIIQHSGAESKGRVLLAWH